MTLNPPIVIGPWLPGYARQNDSSMIVKEWATGESGAPPGGMGFIDVRDLAEAHVLAMQTPAARGRYLIAAGSMYFADACRAIKRLFPTLPVAVPAASAPSVLKPEYDCGKSERDLGWAPRWTIEESLAAQVAAVVAAGLVRS